MTKQDKQDIDSADRPALEITSRLEAIRAILEEEIALAEPDDLAYLRSQVPRIAFRVSQC